MFTYILFAAAFIISGVAEYYSIAGLVAIFASQPIAAIVMGAALGVGKLVAASWVYRNWTTAPKILIVYFTSAVVILSLITSMGIFGYLSKAHLDQSVVIGGSADRVRLLDEKIKNEKENIATAKQAIKQMDAGVEQILGRSTDEKGATNAMAFRRSQQKERQRLVDEVETAQKKIGLLNEERAPLAADLSKIEAEVGPIKYVAELVYGASSEEVIGKAVRLMIILIICVFDPMAILLLIAGNMEMKKKANAKWDDFFKMQPIEEPEIVEVNDEPIYNIKPIEEADPEVRIVKMEKL